MEAGWRIHRLQETPSLLSPPPPPPPPLWAEQRLIGSRGRSSRAPGPPLPAGRPGPRQLSSRRPRWRHEQPALWLGYCRRNPRSGPHSRKGTVCGPRGDNYRDILHKTDWQVLEGSSSLRPPDCPTVPRQSSAGAGAEKKKKRSLPPPATLRNAGSKVNKVVSGLPAAQNVFLLRTIERAFSQSCGIKAQEGGSKITVQPCTVQ